MLDSENIFLKEKIPHLNSIRISYILSESILSIVNWLYIDTLWMIKQNSYFFMDKTWNGRYFKPEVSSYGLNSQAHDI